MSTSFIVNAKKDLERQVGIAARDYGISTVLFRNATGRKLGFNIADMECLSLLLLKGISTPRAGPLYWLNDRLSHGYA